jgi:DNA-binding NarL/FixJ family response regulator
MLDLHDSMNSIALTGRRLPRVLLADDQPTYLAEMAELLRGAGFDCDCVADGRAAEAELQRGVDVLVADIRMPGNFNLELGQRAKAMQNPPAVILMTGFPTLETAITSVKLKIDGYLVKPFGYNELLEEVSRAVNARLEALDAASVASTSVTSPPESAPGELPGLSLLSSRHPTVGHLTRREQEVLMRVLMGDDVPAIGSALLISPHTVRNHLKAIYRKLDVRSRVELVVRLGPLPRVPAPLAVSSLGC